MIPGPEAAPRVAAAAGATTETAQAIGYPSLFLLVLLGALVPVVPTGALVSSATVVAFHQHDPVLSSLLVFTVATLAAFAGDTALFLVGQRGARSPRRSGRLERTLAHVAPEALARAEHQLARRGTTVLVVSRLLPGGRIPVMLACLLARMPLRRYLRGAAAAALAWAATYQLIGLLGGALFPQPWQGVAAAVALTLLISVAPAAGRRLRRTPEQPPGPSPGR